MQRRVIALGCFDGVHLGHAALLSCVRDQAIELGATAAVMTFDVHPSVYLRGQSVPLLTDNAERERRMKALGIEEVLLLRFDAVRQMPWRDFAEQMLFGQYGAVALVCGEDFRFGAGGEGTAEKLRRFCAERGTRCTVIGKVAVDGEIVSSTAIRTLIQNGEMEKAAKMLGVPHTLSGTVQVGNRLGHTLGTPTANVPFAENGVVPAFGVYAAEVTAEGRTYKAVVNVGVHPTVGALGKPIAEAWLQNFNGDLYGKPIRIAFLRRLRGERKFASVEELQKQMQKDAEML